MFRNLSPHVRALLTALFVTFLWSTSWVFIKIGLSDIPPVTFAGLRYALAFVCLLPMAIRPARRSALRRLNRSQWLRLIVLGLMFIAVTQGAQYVALDHMPAATVSLLLNFSAIIVAVLGIVLLAERPTALQWFGSVLFIGGVLVYFYPVAIPTAQIAGLVATIVGVIANAGSSVLGRQINRDGKVDPFLVTFITIGVGALVLLIVGFSTGRAPNLTPLNWLIILWLAAVNTAFAFLLWNQTLQVLSAVESSMINNAMMIQIPIMAWVFLGESLTGQAILGMLIAGVGMLLVQLRRSHPALIATPEEPVVTAELTAD